MHTIARVVLLLLLPSPLSSLLARTPRAYPPRVRVRVPDLIPVTKPVPEAWVSLRYPCPFERNRSSPASTRPFRARPLVSHPTMSIRAQLLVSHLHHVLPSPIADLPPNRVHLSATVRVPPPPGPFELDRSSPTQPYQLEPHCSSPAATVSFRAQSLVLCPPHCFEPNSSSLASTMPV